MDINGDNYPDLALYLNGSVKWEELEPVAKTIKFIQDFAANPTKRQHKGILLDQLDYAIRSSCDILGNTVFWDVREHCDFSERALDMRGLVVTPLSMYLQNFSGACHFYLANGNIKDAVIDFEGLELDATGCSEVIVAPFNKAHLTNAYVTGKIRVIADEGVPVSYYGLAVSLDQTSDRFGSDLAVEGGTKMDSPPAAVLPELKSAKTGLKYDGIAYAKNSGVILRETTRISKSTMESDFANMVYAHKAMIDMSDRLIHAFAHVNSET